MAILRAVRFLCVLAGLAAVVFGAMSVFQGEWGRVGLAVLALVVAMVVFGVAQNGIERAERGDVVALLGPVESMLAVGDWDGALVRTTEATGILTKSVKAVGKQSSQVGPLASALVTHSLVLGGNGKVSEAQAAIARAIQILVRIPDPTPLAEDILNNARAIEQGLRASGGNPAAATAFCRSMV